MSVKVLKCLPENVCGCAVSFIDSLSQPVEFFFLHGSFCIIKKYWEYFDYGCTGIRNSKMSFHYYKFLIQSFTQRELYLDLLLSVILYQFPRIFSLVFFFFFFNILSNFYRSKNGMILAGIKFGELQCNKDAYMLLQRWKWWEEEKIIIFRTKFDIYLVVEAFKLFLKIYWSKSKLLHIKGKNVLMIKLSYELLNP